MIGGPSGALRDRWVFVSVAALLYWTAAMALRPMVALRLAEMALSPVEIGVVVAANPVVALLLALPSGRVIDRLGGRRALWSGLSAMALTGVGYASVSSVVPLLLLQLCNGVAEMVVWIALQTLISRSGSGDVLKGRLAVFSLGWGVGTALGPVVGTWIFSSFGFTWIGVCYTALSVSCLVALASPRLAADSAGLPSGAGAVADIRNIVGRPVVGGVLIATFVCLFLNSVRSSFYPLFLQEAGTPVPSIGILLSVMGVASVVVRIPLPYLLRFLLADRVLQWGMWCSLVAMTVTPWLPNFPMLVAAAVVIGVGYGVNPPLTLQLISEATEVGERGLAMGLRVTFNRLAQVSQPLLFGVLMSTVGAASAFAFSGVALAGLATWSGFLARRNPPRKSN